MDAGAWSLLRQFQSGLTNQRDDRFGADRMLFTRLVLQEVRRRTGPSGVVALRLACDELAPWAGVTPEQATAMVDELAPSGLVDLLTVVRGGPYSTSAYRPDAHVEAGFNRDLCAAMRVSAAGRVPVVLQGSVVDPAMAADALGAGICDLVEMTRALVADAEMLLKVRGQRPGAVRPCIRCNQACRVRDNRNPILSCVVDPASGHEADEAELVGRADEAGQAGDGRSAGETGQAGDGGPAGEVGATREAGTDASGRAPVLVVGGGPAGMECARVLAEGGRRVRLVERSDALGGVLAAAAVGSGREPMRRATDWLASEVARLGVSVELGRAVDGAEVSNRRRDGQAVVLATGSVPVTDRYAGALMPVLDPLAVLADPGQVGAGPVAVVDTVGDAVAVNLAEWLATVHGRTVTLICPDPVAGTQLSRTGDLADANGRLQRAGVERRLRSLVRRIGPGSVEVEDCWTAAVSEVPAACVVDCGHRRPDEALYLEVGDSTVPRAGDCVAPRSLLEAVLEGRRVALGMLGVATLRHGAEPVPVASPAGWSE